MSRDSFNKVHTANLAAFPRFFLMALCLAAICLGTISQAEAQWTVESDTDATRSNLGVQLTVVNPSGSPISVTSDVNRRPVTIGQNVMPSDNPSQPGTLTWRLQVGPTTAATFTLQASGLMGFFVYGPPRTSNYNLGFNIYYARQTSSYAGAGYDSSAITSTTTSFGNNSTTSAAGSRGYFDEHWDDHPNSSIPGETLETGGHYYSIIMSTPPGASYSVGFVFLPVSFTAEVDIVGGGYGTAEGSIIPNFRDFVEL
jgi:hypothetical protein